MSLLGKEFVTEFGEFVTFTTEEHGNPEYKEPFQEFVSLSEVPIEQTRNYQQISQAVENTKTQQ
ncbi:hypothetical protein TVAG_132170 [Trichomonas vaginalis G3]|uniref:Uncharacterized protein n=1 Tax=Trichomonas vaginalis (strain ATCC PRA-98 / G3) TaxID=412133 RepID=A2FNK0_TRIV3|nr:hypothetical protein TVAGG3_0735800 [Trichomonas vaginalis G3]EAX93500.1 hypothetical protein TVAG_132170 [Trichomonas vaginalis G3]KAI5511573.1 hypothetical protein TVAGG3_0735800 [Trichomonas vaginalis G3]|eukprot:XP_001306430.1 hypothetical protein [Trichomonas vaginalis G3]